MQKCDKQAKIVGRDDNIQRRIYKSFFHHPKIKKSKKIMEEEKREILRQIIQSFLLHTVSPVPVSRPQNPYSGYGHQ